MLDPSTYLDDIDQPAPAPTTEVVDDAAWESPESKDPADTKTAPAESTEDAGTDDETGDSQDDGEDGDDDAGWDDKPAAAVVEDDKDSKARIPSWRVREIREQKDAEIAAAKADAQAAREELARVRSGAPAKTEEAPDPSEHADRARVIAAISERDPVIKDASDKLQAIQHLVENAPEELVKYFRNADHMAAEVAKLTSIRETRLNAHLTKIETDHANEISGREKAQTEHVTKLIGDYDTAIKASKIPNITKYAQRLASNADKLHVGIREMILTGDDKDVVTAAIGSNRALFDELAAVDPRKPLSPVQLATIGIKLGKAVSAYTNKPRGSFVEDDEPAQKAVQPTAVRRSVRAPTSAQKYRVDKDGTIVM